MMCVNASARECMNEDRGVEEESEPEEARVKSSFALNDTTVYFFAFRKISKKSNF